jgi:hypothetical protein
MRKDSLEKNTEKKPKTKTFPSRNTKARLDTE